MSYRQQQIKMIAEIDQCIDMVRQNWLDAPKGQKRLHMDKIDQWLDQRLICMHNRDM